LSNTNKNTVSLRELSMPKDKAVKLTVQLNASTLGDLFFDALVKQANDFNDTGGSANLFSNPTFPKLAVEGCVGTISGRVWNDSDESKTKQSSERAQNNWTVRLLRKNTTTGEYTTLESDTPIWSTDGLYTFTDVPLNKDYIVCEAKPASGPDAAKDWSQTTDTNYSC
jgi:hypothetical protein